MRMPYVNGKPLFSGFLVGPFQHLKMLLFSRAYRTYAHLSTRYGRMPRYSRVDVLLNKKIFTVPDIASFLAMYEDIFVHEIYKLPTCNRDIRILDLGANIGLSVAYFKQLYPSAKVVAYEADPTIYKYLQANLRGISDVEIHNAAIWNSEGEIKFVHEGADGGRITLDGADSEYVSSVDIKQILQQNSFDMIKMDIEGAESVVLPACKGLLQNTRYLFCEYHNTCGEEQTLDKLLFFLRNEGFYYHIESINKIDHPFIRRAVISGYDMQLNIFAWKPE